MTQINSSSIDGMVVTGDRLIWINSGAAVRGQVPIWLMPGRMTNSIDGTIVSAKQPEPEDRRIGKLLRARRLVLAMSQTQLGAAIGVSFQQIQKYEQGINRVGAGRLMRLSDALDVSPAYFFPESASHDPSQSGTTQDGLLDRKNLRALIAFSLVGDESMRDALLELMENAARCFPRPALAADEPDRRGAS